MLQLQQTQDICRIFSLSHTQLSLYRRVHHRPTPLVWHSLCQAADPEVFALQEWPISTVGCRITTICCTVNFQPLLCWFIVCCWPSLNKVTRLQAGCVFGMIFRCPSTSCLVTHHTHCLQIADAVEQTIIAALLGPGATPEQEAEARRKYREGAHQVQHYSSRTCMC